MADIYFSDISEFQTPVTDAYPHPVLSIRSNDGTYRDHNFAANYRWMRTNLDNGRLTCGIIYAYLRPNWGETVATMKDMITSNGGLHPRVALMLDVESGGNPSGDASDWINRTYWSLADWAGNPKRIFGYANAGDFQSMWRTRPDGLRIVGAGYGQNPNLPGQIAHQYTDGTNGSGQGLPMGAPPFGNCDMNTAPMSALEFAGALGIGTTPGGTVPTPTGQPGDDQPLKQGYFRDFITGFVGPVGSDVKDSREQLTGGRNAGQYPGWDQLGNRSIVDALAAIGTHLGIPGFSDPKAGK